MATNFCQKCKQSHPGRICDYDEKGECAETLDPSQDDKQYDKRAVLTEKSAGRRGRRTQLTDFTDQ